ncbi:MAG TPA: hypothetical protein VK525_03670 [Candidatus Saccharimonadales bacterium]|nr:hypothetical protein [Candidatus Saccharimonadales bacterium]
MAINARGNVSSLRCCAAWAALTYPGLLLVVRLDGGRFDADAIIYLFPLLALPFLGTVILWLLTLRIHATVASISIGVAIGLLLPTVDSRIWMLCFPGFESSTAFFTSAVVISLPNALGGGVAGWLRTRVRRSRTTNGFRGAKQKEFSDIVDPLVVFSVFG